MPNELKIAATEHTPSVHFNAESGTLSIEGRSMPEDIGKFFNPLSEWVKEYISNPSDHTELKIFFEYYNSSTARRLTEIIFELEQLTDQGKKVNVVWLHKPADLLMKENGEEIKSIVDLPFEVQSV